MTDKENKIFQELRSVCSEISPNVILGEYTTWGIGGEALYFAEPRSEDELCKLIKVANRCLVPYIVMGRGSNLLVADKGVAGLVIRLGEKFSSISVDGCLVEVQAGAYVPCLARKACVNGLAGIEHVVGIPASFGGLVSMNGGSRRQNIGEVIIQVSAVDREGNLFVIEHDDCGFEYRTSRFQNDDLIVVSAKLQLQRSERNNIRKESLEILRERRRKFPLKSKNCGSVFLSTPDLYEQFGAPGKVIEDAKLKGCRYGGMVVSPAHANFIINDKNGSSEDVLILIQKIRETVFQAIGYALVCEVRYLNENAEIVPVSDILPLLQ